MKISGALGLAPPAALARPPAASSAGSFASLLASGRNADSIRSERAFGFSETGLFGAERSSKGGSGRNASSDRGNVLVDASPKPALMETSVGSGPQSRVAALSASPARSGTIAPPAYTGPSSMTVVRFLPQNAARPDIGSRSKADPLAKLPFDGANFTINTALLREQRKRQLAISGPDDALCVTVAAFGTQDCEQDGLFSTFFSTALQYGMTLGSVRLRNYD